MKPVTRWRQWYVGPVPVAVTTVRLVGAARYLNLRTHSPGHPVLNTQLRTPSPHRILLELRSHRPRPITRGKSSGDFQPFTDSVTRQSTIPLGCSRPWRLTVCQKHSLQRWQASDPRRINLFSDAQSLWVCRCLGLGFPHLMIFTQSPRRMGCSQMTKAVHWNLSSQPFMVVGVSYL